MYTTCSHGQNKVTPADDQQVQFFNPRTICTVRPLPVQNKRRLLKLYNNTQNVPQPSFTEEINQKHPTAIIFRKPKTRKNGNVPRPEQLLFSRRKKVTDSTYPEHVTKRQVTHIHPTMRNILRRTQNLPSLCTYIDSSLFQSVEALQLYQRLCATFFFLA